MRVLGLDPGSRRTGYGIVERRGQSLAWVAHGSLSPPSSASLPLRLAFLADGAVRLIEEFAPQVVVVEEAFHHEFARSTLVLGHVRGALIVTAAQREIPIAEYAPRSIKLAVTGSGAASKSQVAAMVARLLTLDAPPQADAADALAGAICHLQRARWSAPERQTPAKRRLEALLATRVAR